MRGIGIGIIVTAIIFLAAGLGDSSMSDEEIKAKAKELGMSETTFVSDIAKADQNGDKVEPEIEAIPTKEVLEVTRNVTPAVVTDDTTPGVTKEATPEVSKDVTTNVTKEVTPNVTKEVTPTVTTKVEVTPTKATDEKQTGKYDASKDDNDVPDSKAEELLQKVNNSEKLKPVKEPTKAVEPTKEPTKAVEPTKTVEPTKVVTKPEPTKEVKPTAEPTKAPEPTKPVVTGGDDKTVIIVVNSGDGSGTVARKLYEAGIVANANEYDQYLMANGYDRTISVGNHVISVTASKEEIAKNLTSPTR